MPEARSFPLLDALQGMYLSLVSNQLLAFCYAKAVVNTLL
jgi:hypothetical protein